MKDGIKGGEFLSVTQAAGVLGVSRFWVYNQMRRDPTFPSLISIPGSNSKFIRRSRLNVWIESLESQDLSGIDAVTRRKLATEEAA